MNKYIWCEDKGAGFIFWEKLFAVINPKIIVQSKRNNTALRKAAAKITADGNIYYILMDQAIDSTDTLREVRKLNESIEGKSNVHLIKIHSFEFAILSFEYLENWVFAKEDELKEKRKHLLEASRILVYLIINGGDSDKLSELKKALTYSDNVNTEQLSAKLLFQITRNTGFETDKGHLGECFMNTCCEWKERQPDDICGLDGGYLSYEQKVGQIVEHSSLKEVLQVEGL